MNTKHKKYKFLKLSLFFIIFFIFNSGGYVLAKNDPSLPDAIKNVFDWGIGIVALLASISFAAGAIQFFAFGENPEQKKGAKDRMLGSILGMILMLISYLIMNTINPKIESLGLEGLGGVPGIFYTNGNPTQDKPAPLQEAVSDTVKDLGFTGIKYTCAGDPKDAIPLLIWFYPKTYFRDDNENFYNTSVVEVECGKTAEIKGKSFKMSFKYPGVYFYFKDDCNGAMTEAFNSDITPIPEQYKGKIKSFKIVWDRENYIKKGYMTYVILKDNQDLTAVSNCSDPIYTEKCHKITMENVTSAHIFQGGGNVDNAVETYLGFYRNASGYVNFYSKPWGDKPGTFAGWYINSVQGGGLYGESKDLKSHIIPKEAKFDYLECGGGGLVNSCETESYKNKCPSFAECPGSIMVSGNYLVILTTDKDYGIRGKENQTDEAVTKCQVFYSSINSVKETEFSATGNTIGSVKIIRLIK